VPRAGRRPCARAGGSGHENGEGRVRGKGTQFGIRGVVEVKGARREDAGGAPSNGAAVEPEQLRAIEAAT